MQQEKPGVVSANGGEKLVPKSQTTSTVVRSCYSSILDSAKSPNPRSLVIEM